MFPVPNVIGPGLDAIYQSPEHGFVPAILVALEYQYQVRVQNAWWIATKHN